MKALRRTFEDSPLNVSLQVEKPAQGMGVSRVHIVAREKAHGPAPFQNLSQMCVDEIHSTLENEGHGDVDLVRRVEILKKGTEKRVVQAASDHYACRLFTPPKPLPVSDRSWRVDACKVVRSGGKDVSHAPARIGNVALIPRNDVHVQVEDRLARALADVHADVEAVWEWALLRSIALQDRFPCDCRRLTKLSTFLCGRLEPARDVPLRN